MTPEQIKTLERAAERASVGPWKTSPKDPTHIIDCDGEYIASASPAHQCDEACIKRNAAYIAAAHPAVILDLLAEREAYNARIAKLEAAARLAMEFIRSEAECRTFGETEANSDYVREPFRIVRALREALGDAP